MSSESTLSLRQISLHDEPWRNALLEMLELRDQREMVIFDFEQAVDQGGGKGEVMRGEEGREGRSDDRRDKR